MKQQNVVNVLIGLCVILFMVNTIYAGDPPIAHWKLDESEGLIAEDAIGERDGMWVGEVRWRPTEGFYGGAIECDDDSSFVEVDNSDGSLFEDLTTSFTFSVWVMIDEFTQDWQGIITHNDKFFLERNNSGSSGTANAIHFKVKDQDGAQPLNLYGNIPIDDGD